MRTTLHNLKDQKRIVTALPKNGEYGRDPFVYRINPTKNKVNFPDEFKQNGRNVELRRVIEASMAELTETDHMSINAEDDALMADIDSIKM